MATDQIHLDFPTLYNKLTQHEQFIKDSIEKINTIGKKQFNGTQSNVYDTFMSKLNSLSVNRKQVKHISILNDSHPNNIKPLEFIDETRERHNIF